MTDVVVVERGERVWRVRLNRPDKLNALNDDVRAGLHDAFAALADEPDVAVVVLSGDGRAFSAGADLVGAAAPPSSPSWAARRHAVGGWQRLLQLMERVPQVTVASVHGHCIGGAALLAAACDLRIAADTLSVRIPELAIGIPLTWEGIPRLAREIGLPLARDLVMTGRSLEAAEAQSCGFVQRLVPAADLAAATDSLVAELLAMPAGPLALTRGMFGALGRERLSPAGWADADILAWSFTEDEGRAAARDYRLQMGE
jgi:enoyl-CoA hydratase/carnithine racemase